MNGIVSKQSRAICWIAVLLCIGGGCVRSLQPILKDDQVFTDDHFLGSWVSSDGKTSGVVTAPDDHNRYQLVYTDENGKHANLMVRLGRVGDMTIAESSIGDPAPDASDVYKMHLQPVYCFMLVKQSSAQQLVLKIMNSDWFSKYMKAHPTELAVSGDNDNLLITASTPDFQAFLLRHAKDDGAYGDDGVFVRPGDPTTRATTAPAASGPAHVP